MAIAALISTADANTVKFPPTPFTGVGIKKNDTVYKQTIDGLNYEITSRWVSSRNGIAYGGWRAFDGNLSTEAQGYGHYNGTTGLPFCSNKTVSSCQHTIQFQVSSPIFLEHFKLAYNFDNYASALTLFGCPSGTKGVPTEKCSTLYSVKGFKGYRTKVMGIDNALTGTFKVNSQKAYTTFILRIDRLKLSNAKKNTMHRLKEWSIYGNHYKGMPKVSRVLTNTLGVFPITNPNKCARKCIENPECVKFEIISSMNACWLKGETQHKYEIVKYTLG